MKSGDPLSAVPPAAAAAILIVEDEALIALDLQLQLQDMGYRVVGPVDSGEQALVLAAQERPDLALMDINLRGALNGVQTAERLRAAGGPPVVFLTSHTDAPTVTQAAGLAPHGYLGKPFQAGELRASIEVALARAGLERRLRASEQRWRRVFDDAPLGMALVSLQGGEVVQANATLARLLGVPALQLRGRLHVTLNHPQDVALEAVHLQPLQRGTAEAVQFEKRYLRADGSVLWTQVSVSLLEAGSDAPMLLFQVHDLTAQKQAQQQQARLEAERVALELREAQQQAQSQLLSRVSHEMRTPLNAVLGFAQLLRMAPPESREARGAEYIAHIEQAGRHLLAMVDDLLVLQRANEGQLHVELQAVPLAQCVHAALGLLQPQAQAHRVTLHQAVDAGLRVRADPTRLHQVLVNLASNAVKYNRPGGELRVTAHHMAGEPVRLVFSDTGIGMTPQQLREVFRPFSRAGRERSAIPGTGLGLVISRRLAEAMGGALWIDSEPRGGTVATLELQAAP